MSVIDAVGSPTTFTLKEVIIVRLTPTMLVKNSWSYSKRTKTLPPGNY